MIDLKGFRKVNNLTQMQLADYLGVHYSFIGNIECGRSLLPMDKLQMILGNKEGWDTSMLRTMGDMGIKADARNHSTASVTIGSNNNYGMSKKADPERTGTIPVIPTDAHAGMIGDYSDSVMPYQCEYIQSPIKGATCAIRVYGDSMEPRYSSGSLAFLKKVDPNIFIEWGKTYVIDTPNGAVMKMIEQSEDPDKVTCVSLNDRYKPYDVPVRAIAGWYRVLGVLMFD